MKVDHYLKDLTFFNIRACNIARPFSLLGCLFGWRAGSIGELTHVNGQQMWTERLNVSKVRRQDESLTASFLF